MQAPILVHMSTISQAACKVTASDHCLSSEHSLSNRSSYQSQLAFSKENGRPSPVEQQIANVEGDRQGSFTSGSVLNDQEGRVAHGRVEQRPDDGKDPIWRREARLVQFLDSKRDF